MDMKLRLWARWRAHALSRSFSLALTFSRFLPGHYGGGGRWEVLQVSRKYVGEVCTSSNVPGVNVMS